MGMDASLASSYAPRLAASCRGATLPPASTAFHAKRNGRVPSEVVLCSHAKGALCNLLRQARWTHRPIRFPCLAWRRTDRALFPAEGRPQRPRGRGARGAGDLGVVSHPWLAARDRVHERLLGCRVPVESPPRWRRREQITTELIAAVPAAAPGAGDAAGSPRSALAERIDELERAGSTPPASISYRSLGQGTDADVELAASTRVARRSSSIVILTHARLKRCTPVGRWPAGRWYPCPRRLNAPSTPGAT